jgi:hypothetical protein
VRAACVLPEERCGDKQRESSAHACDTQIIITHEFYALLQQQIIERLLLCARAICARDGETKIKQNVDE